MKKIQRITAAFLACLCLCGCGLQGGMPTQPDATQNSSIAVTTTTTPTQEQIPTTTAKPPVIEPEGEEFILSFAGDCTFGDNFDAQDQYGTFCKVVGDNYDYPFQNVRTWFEKDEYSFVNLECALTESDPTDEEMEELKENLFRFRGPAAYAKILSGSSVEFASCANNHSKDYGKQGLEDTWAALEAEKVEYASFGKSRVVTTKNGLKIGVFTVFFNTGKSSLEYITGWLKKQGAQIIVMSVHWGDEGSYEPNETQQKLARMAVDAGVDIVYGHHSHTLQRIEHYGGGVIFYSLGNFSFGGHRNPKDKDTAIIRQSILRYEDGTLALGDLEIVPCRISTVDNWNDFRPTPYDPEHPGYNRVFAKLEGSFEGDALEVPYQTTPKEDNQGENER